MAKKSHLQSYISVHTKHSDCPLLSFIGIELACLQKILHFWSRFYCFRSL